MITPKNRQLSGQFLNANDINIGSIPTGGFNCIDISLKAYQSLVNTKTNQVGLKIYFSNMPLLNYTGANPPTNLNEALLWKSIKINTSTDTEACYYNETLRINGAMPHIVFILSNEANVSNGDLYFDFQVNTHNNGVDNYKIRDAIVGNEENVLLTRETCNFLTDAQDQNLNGVETWGLSCKGNLTNSERLLQDDGISTMGYFNSTKAHAVNTIRMKSSLSTDVALSGIGARIIRLHGLNGVLERVKSDVLLNGTSVVSSGTTMTEVNSAEVLYAGDLYCNAGTITIYNDDGGVSNPQCVIGLNYGFSANPQYCVPIGYVLLIQKISCNSHCEDEGELNFNYYDWNLTYGATILKKRLQSFNLHSTTNFQHDVEWRITEGQRFTITTSLSSVATGINRVSVKCFGILKKTNLGISSNIQHNPESTNVRTSQY
jgi:hypothetical protein